MSNKSFNVLKGHLRGFTLVELLFVLAVTSTLAAIAIPAYTGYLEKVRIVRAEVEIRDMDKYISTLESLPVTLTDLKFASQFDPWGNPYQFFNFSTTNSWLGKARKDMFLVPLNSEYDLYSMGKDGESKPPLVALQSQDDVVRANDGEYIGLASKY